MRACEQGYLVLHVLTLNCTAEIYKIAARMSGALYHAIRHVQKHFPRSGHFSMKPSVHRHTIPVILFGFRVGAAVAACLGLMWKPSLRLRVYAFSPLPVMSMYLPCSPSAHKCFSLLSQKCKRSAEP